jgi:excisionase family DNA binding protein
VGGHGRLRILGIPRWDSRPETGPGGAKTGACSAERRALGPPGRRCQSAGVHQRQRTRSQIQADPAGLKFESQERFPRPATGVARHVVHSVAQGKLERVPYPSGHCSEGAAPSGWRQHRRRIDTTGGADLQGSFQGNTDTQPRWRNRSILSLTEEASVRHQAQAEVLSGTDRDTKRLTDPGAAELGRHRGRRPAPEGRAGQRLLLTVEEAADRLCVGRTYMFDLIAKGVVPSVRLGKLRRIRAEDLERYVSSLT